MELAVSAKVMLLGGVSTTDAATVSSPSPRLCKKKPNVSLAGGLQYSYQDTTESAHRKDGGCRIAYTRVITEDLMHLLVSTGTAFCIRSSSERHPRTAADILRHWICSARLHRHQLGRDYSRQVTALQSFRNGSMLRLFTLLSSFLGDLNRLISSEAKMQTRSGPDRHSTRFAYLHQDV